MRSSVGIFGGWADTIKRDMALPPSESTSFSRNQKAQCFVDWGLGDGGGLGGQIPNDGNWPWGHEMSHT